jgi:urease accessory protein
VVAPVEISPARTGHASLKVEVIGGESAVTSAFASSPLKLLTPRSRGRSVWAYTSSFGGGLVAGDETRLEVTLGPAARCFLGTQASTKVYRNPAQLPCGHVTQAKLDAGALLVFAPDPVQAFAGSTYAQRQEFHLAPDASLVLLDWFTSGRAARGERWAFSRFASRNDVFVDGQRAFLDSIRLDASDGTLDSSHRVGRFNCFATLLVIGPLVQPIAASLLTEIGTRAVDRRASFVGSASPIRDGALLRIATEQVEAVGHELHRHLAPLTGLLGDDPWARKW